MSQDKAVGNKFSIIDSVSYADGSVVSKTIIKRSSGNVTLFAFDQGEGLAEHTTPFEALVQILDGIVDITIGGVVHQLEKGECIILPAKVPHALKAVEKFKMMLTMIKGE